jgi:hypothetical protein
LSRLNISARDFLYRRRDQCVYGGFRHAVRYTELHPRCSRISGGSDADARLGAKFHLPRSGRKCTTESASAS